jgi:hypothetical protein
MPGLVRRRVRTAARPWRGIGALARVRVRPDRRRPAAGGHVKGIAMRSEQPLVPFVVGRLGKGDRRVVVLDAETPPPIPGPWDLRAVFSK